MCRTGLKAAAVRMHWLDFAPSPAGAAYLRLRRRVPERSPYGASTVTETASQSDPSGRPFFASSPKKKV